MVCKVCNKIAEQLVIHKAITQALNRKESLPEHLKDDEYALRIYKLKKNRRK